MVKKKHTGPAAEDIGLVDDLNTAVMASGLPGGGRAWMEKHAGIISRTGLSLTRLGYIASADSEIEPGESILVWERYFGDQAPRLDLDEFVTILSETGEEIVTKQVEQFTREELLKYCGRYFWLTKEELLPCGKVMGLSESAYSQIEVLQHSKGWDQVFASAVQEHDFQSIPGTWMQFYPQVVTVRNFGAPVRYLAEDGSVKPILDPMEVRIFDLTGQEVCRKQMVELTEPELLSYCTEHVWSYSTDD